MPARLRDGAGAAARRLLSRPYPEIDWPEGLVDRLAHHLAPEAADFRRLTGMPFEGWSV